MAEKLRHYENQAVIPASGNEVFQYANNHANFSSHMSKSSWMMGGGGMDTHADERKFQEVGSHLQMKGTVFGVKLFLDEVVTKHNPPFNKEWQTVGNLNLLVIGHYKLGFEITSSDGRSKLKVYIDYELPKSPKTYWLGILFGEMYAKWCVKKMLTDTQTYFQNY